MKKPMGRIAVLSLILATATFGSGIREVDANSNYEDTAARKFTACSNRSLKGTYGIQMQGTRPIPGGTGTEALIGVVARTYDGRGNFTQVDNIKGAVTGIAPNRQGSGTYVVNADCTGSTLFQPGPGVSIEEALVIVDYGFEVRSITITPLQLMVTSVGKRIGWR
jgi:hypothetical protein